MTIWFRSSGSSSNILSKCRDALPYLTAMRQPRYPALVTLEQLAHCFINFNRTLTARLLDHSVAYMMKAKLSDAKEGAAPLMPILMWPLEEARAIRVVRPAALLCLRGSEIGVMAARLSILGPGTSLERIIPGAQKH